jgi:ribonuclease BN (tRNA processing enzyme)
MRTRNVMLATLTTLATIASAHAACGNNGVAVQILGSGGPVADDGRASAGSLIWIDGHARVLVDVGGGVFLRFGESGARLEDLQAIAITHFHADHSADLPALVKSGFFSDRSLPLTISGPGAGGEFPSLHDFLSAQFDNTHGAFRYLSGALDGSGGQFKLEPVQIPADAKQASPVINSAGLVVEAVGVPHGPVPALAYRIETRGLRIVFSGDQNGSEPEFWNFAKNADLLVMTLAVPENADPVARKLHALPSVIGAGAATAHVKTLLLSHLMARSLKTLDDNLAIIHRAYSGPTLVAKDLMCIPLDVKK